MTVSEYRRTLQGTYHGPVLDDVASQVYVHDGKRMVRYPKDYWHEYFKLQCNAGRSTTELTDPEYSLYITKTEALACTRLGVEFTDLKPRDRDPAAQPARERT